MNISSGCLIGSRDRNTASIFFLFSSVSFFFIVIIVIFFFFFIQWFFPFDQRSYVSLQMGRGSSEKGELAGVAMGDACKRAIKAMAFFFSNKHIFFRTEHCSVSVSLDPHDHRTEAKSVLVQ